jgi:hypothetical protein
MVETTMLKISSIALAVAAIGSKLLNDAEAAWKTICYRSFPASQVNSYPNS